MSLIHSAGNQWARAAERLIFANYGKVSVSNLMVRHLHSLPLLGLAPLPSS